MQQTCSVCQRQKEWLDDRLEKIETSEFVDDALITKVLKIVDAFGNEDMSDLIKFCNMLIKITISCTLVSIRKVHMQFERNA
jgi:hypothetical protein